jgi:hypothetical protein
MLGTLREAFDPSENVLPAKRCPGARGRGETRMDPASRPAPHGRACTDTPGSGQGGSRGRRLAGIRRRSGRRDGHWPAWEGRCLARKGSGEGGGTAIGRPGRAGAWQGKEAEREEGRPLAGLGGPVPGRGRKRRGRRDSHWPAGEGRRLAREGSGEGGGPIPRPSAGGRLATGAPKLVPPRPGQQGQDPASIVRGMPAERSGYWASGWVRQAGARGWPARGRLGEARTQGFMRNATGEVPAKVSRQPDSLPAGTLLPSVSRQPVGKGSRHPARGNQTAGLWAVPDPPAPSEEGWN